MIATGKIKSEKIWNGIKRTLGISMMVLFGMATAGGIMEFVPAEIPILAFCFGLFLCGGWIVFGCHKRSKVMADARRLAMAMQGRKSCPIPVMARALAWSENDVRRRAVDCINGGYFNGVGYDAGQDILYIAEASTKELVAVNCDSCRGVTRIPAGSAGVCEYCGGRIQA